MPFRVGYKASAEQFAPRQLIEYGVHAENVGLDSVFISDHFQPWRLDGGHAPAATPWLAALGENTSRVLLGTSVLTPTYRHSPAMVAQAFATLGCLNPGRMVLGVGSGEALNEIAVNPSLEWPAFKERFGRLRESVRLIRALWTGDRVSFDGDYYSTESAAIYDVPDETIPVYIAAGGPTMAKYAGRVGDGFICTSGKGEELYTDQLLPAVDEGLAKNNRASGDIDRMIEIKLSYDTDPDAALENTRFWSPLSLSAEQKHSITDPAEMEAAADALPIDQVARRWIVASNVDEALEGITPYIDWGFNHLVIHAPGNDQGRFLDQFTRDVVPALREYGDKVYG